MATLARSWQRFARNDQILLLLLAVAVGAAGGYGAIAFRLATAGFQVLFFGDGGDRLASAVRPLPWWQVVLAPTLGGLLLGLFMRYVLPGRLPQGVPHVMEAAALRNGRMEMPDGVAAACISAASLGCGASVGREGPIVHLGATLGSYAARRLQLSPALARTLLGCGVAAAIASAFNAPIAGVIFALEVVVGHYGLGAFSPVVISAVIGTVITRIHIGPDPAFILPPQQVVSFLELPAFVLLGLVGALASIALMRSIALVQASHDRLGVPLWLRPMLAGAAVGAMGLWLPEVLGVGYEATDRVLGNQYGLRFVLVLAVAKTAATALSLGSNFPGGIFSPCLVIGAMVGASFGMVADAIFPALGSNASVYALLGMGAVAACVLGAPISTAIMIFELTTDYGVAFAVMICVAVASVFCRQLHWHSFFTWQLAQRGIDLQVRREHSLLRARRLAEVLRREVVTVGLDADLEQLKAAFRHRHLPIFVVDEQQRLYGSIAFEDLADAAFAPDRGEPVTARDLVHRTPIALLPQDNLETALRLCEAHGEEHMPVVSDSAERKVIGEVRRSDLVLAYNRALLEARAAERGEG
ncbi:MAG TPA: chloride channel protein [Geminicoccaceae bacterium]|nr:chloride channel protein [Geminicoccaceae bacterium]